jgi:hypothetical protein
MKRKVMEKFLYPLALWVPQEYLLYILALLVIKLAHSPFSGGEK